MIKYRIGLTKEEVDELSAILRKGSHSTLRYRVAHILLNCDEGEHGDKVPDRSIGKVLRVSTRTIERTKRRFMEESFPYQSGSSIKGKAKTHYPRNRSLKAMLTKGAITAI